MKFTFEAAVNPDTRSSNEGLDQLTPVEAPDPKTVKVTLKRLTPMFLAQGGSRGIVPKHPLVNDDLTESEFNKNRSGAAPSRL